MKTNNTWLERVEEEVVVHLKQRTWKYDPEAKRAGYEIRDIEEKPEPLIVKVKKYEYAFEKHATIVQAALKHFSDTINQHMASKMEKYVYRGVESDKEPAVVVEPKLMHFAVGGWEGMIAYQNEKYAQTKKEER